MSSADTLTFEDIRNISEAINSYKAKEFDQSLTNLRKVSSKFDENAKGKNRSNLDYSKSKTKSDEFKYHIQFISNKFKASLENLEVTDNNYTSFYNYALLLFYMQQNLQCNKILEKLVEVFKNVDNYMITKYKLLKIENSFIIQSYNQGIKIIEDDLKDDSQNQKSENDKINHLVFLFNYQLMLKQFQSSFETLEKLKMLKFPMVKLYEAHYHYCQNYMVRSLVCLQECDRVSEKEIGYLWNSIGCTHFAMKKFNVAIMYLNRTLNILDPFTKKLKNQSMSVWRQNSMFGRCYEFIHNLGISLLFANYPIEAFDLLLEVINAFPKNPRLWLRLAECCVRAFKLDLEKSEVKFNNLHQVLGGKSMFKKLVFETPIKKSKNNIEEAAAMPTPSLEFGSLCIKNGLSLLQSVMSKELADYRNSASVEAAIKWYKDQKLDVRPGGSICGLELLYLESSLLLNGAFISISLNNYVDTIFYCERLLKQPIISPLYRHYANIYLAEAQAMTNIEMSSVLNILEPLNVVSLSLSPIASVEVSASIYSEKLAPVLINDDMIENDELMEETRAMMLYNQACVYSMYREPDSVQHCLHEAIRRIPKFQTTHYHVFMRMHLELSRRNNRACLEFLADVSQKFPPKNNIEA